MGLRNHSLLFYIWQGTLPLLEDMMDSYGQKHFCLELKEEIKKSNPFDINNYYIILSGSI